MSASLFIFQVKQEKYFLFSTDGMNCLGIFKIAAVVINKMFKADTQIFVKVNCYSWL